MCGPLMQDLVMAALAMQRALELDSDEPQWRAERNRLLSCIPEHTSALLQVRPALHLVSHGVLQRQTPCLLTPHI